MRSRSKLKILQASSLSTKWRPHLSSIVASRAGASKAVSIWEPLPFRARTLQQSLSMTRTWVIHQKRRNWTKTNSWRSKQRDLQRWDTTQRRLLMKSTMTITITQSHRSMTWQREGWPLRKSNTSKTSFYLTSGGVCLAISTTVRSLSQCTQLCWWLHTCLSWGPSSTILASTSFSRLCRFQSPSSSSAGMESSSSMQLGLSLKK